MSEFFNVTLDKDVVLDNSVVSDKTGWTSEKIYKEIIDKRITKFEELEDVDVVNKKDKQLVAFSEATGKFTTIDGIEAGELTGAGLKQVTKLGIEGSPEKPHIVNLPVNTIDFKVPRVNLLKYDTENTDNIISTKNEFNNSESTDFESDDNIVFDGKAHLKTEFLKDMIYEGDLDTSQLYSVTVDKTLYKDIFGFSVEEDGVIQKLNIKAIPFDRLLIPKGDINLSNSRHIDYFKLKAEGKNLRIVCSVDSGKSWKVFKGDKWVNVNLTLDDVRDNGMTTELFNSINDVFWNELVTTNKIRFAYLFSMDDIKDVEELDNLDLQFDSQGKWLQAKEDTYDVVYASNTLLQVYVKFSGDVKVNY
ncbi:signal peptidase II [Clostridium sp. MB40-C1]|uniref:signal peptidase II n=1 Tax=Clostridium sp. MB40-C1 TaxID=3070996 RepID=UPI0027DF6D3D|nr:signal peptidase II [Clostridium sp. MB40-C1]WMJ80984.1 signal peptidase II [Clostridium sp. MB40-C1]